MNNLTIYKKSLRKNQTKEESILWWHIRNRELIGLKFRRQVVFDNYIVDFVCFERKLIIEIDGGQHNDDLKIEADKKRDTYFMKNGFTILRFWNNEITNNIDGVMQVILKKLTPHPNLLPQGEKE